MPRVPSAKLEIVEENGEGVLYVEFEAGGLQGAAVASGG
jgi:hypothetical protein